MFCSGIPPGKDTNMGSEAASGFCTCITTFLCDTCSSPCFSFPFLAEPELCLRFLFLGFPASNVRGILSCLFHVNQRKRKWVILIKSTKLGSDVLCIHYFSFVCSQKSDVVVSVTAGGNCWMLTNLLMEGQTSHC